MNKPLITVLTLGGTIAMTPQSDPDAGAVPTLTGESLIASVPALDSVARVQVQAVRQLGSSQLQFADLEALAEIIQRLDAQGDHAGVVVTQGTDTLEETAFALDCMLNVSFPVVVTGAMRNPSLPGADGPANILAASLVATSEAARGCGTLVVLNDEIHAAQFVRKMHSSLTNAFVSPVAGPLGWLSENDVHIVVRPAAMPKVSLATAPTPAVVPLIKMGLGDNGEVVQAMLQQGGFAGLVIEGTGGGHVSEAMADALEQAAQAMPVIFASRCGSGATLKRTYGYPGSEIDLFRRGLISAGWLDGPKARVLLALLLRNGVNTHDALRAAFSAWGGSAG